MKPVEPASLEGIEISTPEFWEKSLPEREGAFLKLRREDPIRKFKEIDFSQNSGVLISMPSSDAGSTGFMRPHFWR